MSLHQKPIVLPKVASPSPAPVGLRYRWRRWLRRCLVVVLVVLIITPMIMYVSTPRYYRILVIGSDQRANEPARSDVLMVIAIPKSRSDQLTMVSIPRDTKIEHPEKGLQKITHFYAMWDDHTDRLGNRALTQQVVEELLDVNIHATIEVTFTSFTDIVNALGGVDTSQGHLTGEAAQELVHNRFNKPNGDFGRAKAEREVLRNLLSRVRQPTNLQKMYTYLQTSPHARLTGSTTTAGWFALAYLIGHRGNVSLGETNEIVLPGVGQKLYTPDFGKELYYWVLDDNATASLVNEFVR
ncbi:MAG: LCP family protein [Candidatus Kerfeldbacteria bacterium]|nr:LCP family protein [Candidatus Kerfeldbacteria bacterium]